MPFPCMMVSCVPVISNVFYMYYFQSQGKTLSRFFYISTKKCFATFIEETLNLTLGLFLVLFPRSPGWKIKFIILKLAQVRFVFTPNVVPLCFVFYVSFSLTACSVCSIQVQLPPEVAPSAMSLLVFSYRLFTCFLPSWYDSNVIIRVHFT